MDTADKDENTRRAEHGSEREGARDTRASETDLGDRERRCGGEWGDARANGDASGGGRTA